MDEASAPKAAQHGVARWRSRWLLPGGPAVVLAALTIDVLANGPLVRLDRQVWSAVRPIAHSPGWQWAGGGAFSPAQIVVDLADPHLAVPVLVLIALAASARQRSLRPLLTASVAVILLVATVIPAKLMIGRLAPGQLRMQPGDTGAFPSGHTTTATVCYVLAALLLAPLLPAARRRALLVILPAWCVIVGAALVWRNYHWVTDVAAGWALAALILQTTCWLGGRARWAASTEPQVAGTEPRAASSEPRAAGTEPRADGTGSQAAAGSQRAVPGDQPAARTPG
jgi:membrane-associated phospholipid phosphatase